ncbi:unnamed protein product [Nezara viridula]|uniref:G-protein coupled receptors family 1 profile domain-containing protein n=1 Tax=Nezara viridula TaxID=85310 RepID=A0A9P0MPY2_NEZVI|nr:unnamed protein product [Nezara viridula]
MKKFPPTVVVVVAFFICWAPFQAQRLFAMQAQGKHNSPRMVFFYQCITYISGPLYYLSTTVNPFLYNIMSLKFRAAFKEITKCRFESSCPKHLTEYSYAKAVHRIRTSRCVTKAPSVAVDAVAVPQRPRVDPLRAVQRVPRPEAQLLRAQPALGPGGPVRVLGQLLRRGPGHQPPPPRLQLQEGPQLQ